MKRELAQPIYGWVEHGSPIFGSFIALINEKNSFPCFSCANVLMYVWILMDDMFIVFMLLLCFFLNAHFPRRLLQSGIRAWFKHLDWMGSIIGKMKNKG